MVRSAALTAAVLSARPGPRRPTRGGPPRLILRSFPWWKNPPERSAGAEPLRDTTVPTITYYTFFKVGSRNERNGITGISHLFEHMMFNGSAKFGPKEFDRQLEGRGGYSNAYTTND